MPVCRVSLTDLSRLVGRSLDAEPLSDSLPRLKCEVEGLEGDCLYYEATHDRPDLFSAEGLARALKGLLSLERGLRQFTAEPYGEAINEGPEYRPVVLLATVHGMRLDDEAISQIMQLQEKLCVTYGRDRRRVSIGVYDLSKIKFPIRYVAADPDRTSFTPLDGSREMTLREILERHPKGVQYGHLLAGRERFPLLVESEGVALSMPPIINSEETRVTERTRDVLVDVTATEGKAAMEVLKVFATSLAERGEWIGLVEVHTREGTVALDLSTAQMTLSMELVRSLLGLDITSEEAARYLEAMGFGARAFEGAVEVRVPPYRIDVLHPIDLVEEVAMGYGLNRLKPELMPPQHAGREDPLEAFSRKLRELVVGFGFQEVANYMLTSKEVLYTMMEVLEAPTVEVTNPRQEQFACFRTWLTPQLIQVLARSKHATYPQRIFECGDVVLVDKEAESGTREERRLALAVSDSRVTLTDIHAIVSALMEILGVRFALRRAEHTSFIKGRCAVIEVEGDEVGFLGEVHPKVLTEWELEKPVTVAELSVSKLFTLARLLSEPL